MEQLKSNRNMLPENTVKEVSFLVMNVTKVTDFYKKYCYEIKIESSKRV